MALTESATHFFVCASYGTPLKGAVRVTSCGTLNSGYVNIRAPNEKTTTTSDLSAIIGGLQQALDFSEDLLEVVRFAEKGIGPH